MVLLTSCASLTWSRVSVGEPIAEQNLAALVPGEADLGACLHRLGAPNAVWERDGRGIAIAYAWSDGGAWGFSVSYSFHRFTPAARFEYDSSELDRPGVVLWFGPDLVLQRMHRGRFGDLVPERRRPAPVEMLEDGGQEDGRAS